MEHPEDDLEQINHSIEKQMSERHQQMEGERVAQMRRVEEHNVRSKGDGVSSQHLERTESRSGEAPHRRLSPDEVADLRRTQVSEESRTVDRLEQLSTGKHLSEPQNRALQDELDGMLDRTDPHWREADRRTDDGLAEFQEDGAARREFSHVAGTTEHTRWEEEIANTEVQAGRVQGTDFDVEAVIYHPDGKPVRLDYVDYRKDIIVDRKPIGEHETEEQLKATYEEQRARHIEAYEYATGRKVTEYRYSVYASPREI